MNEISDKVLQGTCMRFHGILQRYICKNQADIKIGIEGCDATKIEYLIPYMYCYGTLIEIHSKLTYTHNVFENATRDFLMCQVGD